MSLWRGGVANVTYALQGGCAMLAGRTTSTLVALPTLPNNEQDLNGCVVDCVDFRQSCQGIYVAGTVSGPPVQQLLNPILAAKRCAGPYRTRQAPCSVGPGSLYRQMATYRPAIAATVPSPLPPSRTSSPAAALLGDRTRLAVELPGRSGPPRDTLAAGFPVQQQLLAGASSVHVVRSLHGMVSVMTAAEAARDLLAAIKEPVSFPKLAANLSKHYTAELFDALSGLVQSHMDELSGAELSNLLWAYATVNHQDPSLASSVVQSLIGRLSELGPLELANALWALSRLRLYDAQFVTAASERVWDALPAASPRQLTAILQAYAWFRQQDPQLEDDEDLMRSIASKLRAQVPAASAAELALAMSSMARLRRADEALLADACAALERGAPKAGLQVLAEAAWACAILQHRDASLMEAVAERVAEALRVASGLVPAPPAVAAGVSSSLPLPLRPKTGAKGATGASAAQSTAAQQQAKQRKGTGAQEVGGAARRSVEEQQQQVSLEPGVAAGPPTRFSALWPTQVGPGGHTSPYGLYDRFNPSLPDEWHASTSSGLSFGVLTGIVLSSIGAAETSSASAAADAAALLDADVISKLLWSFGVLHCYSGPLYTLLFRQLPRVHYDRASWSSLARLMGAQIKSFELQGPGQGYSRVNPLEAESANAWARFMRGRPPAHKLPDHFLPAAFVAFHAEAAGRDLSWADGVARPSTPDLTQPQVPGQALSRLALQQEVAAALRGMGLELRASATVDGLFHLEHTTLINGLSICLEVLAAGCCTLDAPYRPMGPAAARLQSLEFRGWTPLVVPFHEWAALAAEDRPPVAAEQATAEARKLYLRRKLEELIGEELPPLPLKPVKRRSGKSR
ncbi:hypothetical protein Agub_g641 [Astrephomene gubernaculifera]|uniref:RAP domain-containing protein n=1 Tax=Astrephomene gubernaculifera TaxID=47775 RepID=A0AAD3DEE0_9CHLO|nr:hypothetical protein Agub_g641 [Astrephomene gubernaculifera]